MLIGLEMFIFYKFRTMLPVVLAQLLKQFQLPSDNIVPSIRLLNQTTNDTTSDSNIDSYRNFVDNNDTSEDNNLFEGYEQSFWNSLNDVYVLSTCLILIAILTCIFHHHADLRLRMVGARVRVACCSLIYRKVGLRYMYVYYKLNMNIK